MKKITILAAALLGSVYFANAQVGIGTPTPSTSAMLDIDSTDKGVLIPRVALTSETSHLINLEGGTTEPVQSLLVYATGKKVEDKTLVSGGLEAGFYYWNINKWERIVDQTHLNQAISNQGGDITKIKELLNFAYGTNGLGTNPTPGTHGGMVYTPAVGEPGAQDYVAPKFEYVTWIPDTTDPTTGTYQKSDITSEITKLIKGSESKTLLFATTDKKKQYYISETYLVNTNNTEVTQAIVDGWETEEVPTGVYEINFIEGVSTNIQTILDQTVSITEDGRTFNTVEQYIQYIALKSDANVGFTVGGIDATDNNGVAIPANSFYYIDKTTGNKVHIDLAALVKNLETETKITKNQSGTVADGDVIIDYKYFNEKQPDIDLNPQQVIDLNADLKKLIEGNTEIKNAISNVLNQGGNVYYGDINGTNVFYTIEPNGDKVAITIPVDIDQLITTINNTSVEKKNELKLALGDKMTTDNTSVFTGNTITIDNVVHYIYKGNFTTKVNANSAVTTGVTLDKDAAKILSLDLRYNGGMVANITDLTLADKVLGFRIGTGNMYQVLGTDDVDANVIIEFASTVDPDDGITTP